MEAPKDTPEEETPEDSPKKNIPKETPKPRVAFADGTDTPLEITKASSPVHSTTAPEGTVLDVSDAAVQKQAEAIVRETLSKAMKEMSSSLLETEGLEIEPTLITCIPEEVDGTSHKLITTTTKVTSVKMDTEVRFERVEETEVKFTETTNLKEQSVLHPSMEIIEVSDTEPGPGPRVQMPGDDSSEEEFELLIESRALSSPEDFEMVDAPSPDIDDYEVVEPEETVPEGNTPKEQEQEVDEEYKLIEPATLQVDNEEVL